MRRFAVVAVIFALAAGGVGAAGLVRAESRVITRTVAVDGVPMIEMSPPRIAGRAPGVVVAHGRAASARLMRGFGDTLVARGYVVVLPDLTGHGANAARLTFGTGGAPDVLQDDLDAAVRHLRSLPTVDPDRIGLIGHSMGAAAVTRYSLAHPDIRATVAISLRSVDGLPADAARPRNLLLLVGAAEMRGFREAALAGVRLADPSAGLETTTGDPAAGTARRAVSVAAVEHISILYSTRAHRESADWLDAALGRPVGGETRPRDRLLPGALLLLAFVIGFVPLARWVLPAGAETVGDSGSPPVPPRYAYPGLAAALAVGVLGAGLLPTTRLPLSVGGYAAGFFALVGVVLLAVGLLASAGGSPQRPAPVVPWRRLGLAVVVLAGYTLAAVVVPTHLALTAAVPVGARWWLLPIVVACVALFLLGAQRLAAGSPWRLPVVLATTAVAILVATLAGLGPAFVVLVLPVLVVQLAWYWVWSLVLGHRAAPVWLAAVLGGIVVGWPIAMSMPLGTG
jgi:dienelactone hydrolase